MTKPPVVYDASSRPVPLDKRIGQGGEGEVFSVNGAGALVAKIFKPERRAEMEVKIAAMSTRSKIRPPARGT